MINIEKILETCKETVFSDRLKARIDGLAYFPKQKDERWIIARGGRGPICYGDSIKFWEKGFFGGKKIELKVMYEEDFKRFKEGKNIADSISLEPRLFNYLYETPINIELFDEEYRNEYERIISSMKKSGYDISEVKKIQDNKEILEYVVNENKNENQLITIASLGIISAGLLLAYSLPKLEFKLDENKNGVIDTVVKYRDSDKYDFTVFKDNNEDGVFEAEYRYSGDFLLKRTLYKDEDKNGKFDTKIQDFGNIDNAKISVDIDENGYVDYITDFHNGNISSRTYFEYWPNNSLKRYSYDDGADGSVQMEIDYKDGKIDEIKEDYNIEGNFDLIKKYNYKFDYPTVHITELCYLGNGDFLYSETKEEKISGNNPLLSYSPNYSEIKF